MIFSRVKTEFKEFSTCYYSQRSLIRACTNKYEQYLYAEKHTHTHTHIMLQNRTIFFDISIKFQVSVINWVCFLFLYSWCRSHILMVIGCTFNNYLYCIWVFLSLERVLGFLFSLLNWSEPCGPFSYVRKY